MLIYFSYPYIIYRLRTQLAQGILELVALAENYRESVLTTVCGYPDAIPKFYVAKWIILHIIRHQGN